MNLLNINRMRTLGMVLLTVFLWLSIAIGIAAKNIDAVGESGTAVNAMACSYSFDKTSAHFSEAGGNGSFFVITQPGCSLTATSNSNWLTIINNHTTQITYFVASNNGAERTGKITMGNATLTVTQAEGCTYTISPSVMNFQPVIAFGSIQVTASSDSCPWSPETSASWISLGGGLTPPRMLGSAMLKFTVDRNSGATRTTTIKIGNKVATINQAGGCDFTLSPSIFNFQAGSSQGGIQITAGDSCPWSLKISDSWVKITSKPSSGSGMLYFSLEPNTGAKRIATITIGNKVATINQAANSNCTFTVNPSSAQVGVNGGELNVGVGTSNFCAWTATSLSPFITVLSGSVSSGSGPVKLKVLPNAGVPRTGSILIAGKMFLVNQVGVNGAEAMWITDLSPGFAAKGAKEFQMTVKGANFVNGCKVRWNGEDRPTAFVNGSTLVATIPASDVTDEGANDVTVAKPNSADETNSEQFMVYGTIANVSSASFNGDALAPASLVSAFGIDLATELKIADLQPLPTELAGTTVTITDAMGKEHQAQLFFVSQGQVNYLMPEGVALGKATVMIESGSGHTSVGSVEIAQVAPALFSANSSGQGIATALALRVKANGQQVYEPVAQYDSVSGMFKAKPIDLTIPGEQVYLIFYGTGIRYRNSLSSVAVEIGGVFGDPLYAGLTPGYLGLDQVNVLVPKSLIGRGEVDVVLTVGGKKANLVRLMFK